MKAIQHYQSQFIAHLEAYNKERAPLSLYEPIQYILGLGGKRLRPILTLMTTDCFDGEVSNALDAGLAIEVFHNFSLIHDDIMDKAPLRRGQKTVHEKWNLNTGILSGDAMLIMAYKLFEGYNAKQFQELTALFSKTALEVCEGQQYDIDFETREDVTVEEYLKMIEYKTAVLVGAALEMGAIVANAPKKEQEQIYNYGKLIGIAFQLQDDYLDAFGDPETFGKRVGGDIIENKKTYLYLQALQKLSSSESEQLRHLYTIFPSDTQQKVEAVTHLFEESGAAAKTREEIVKYTEEAFRLLEEINIQKGQKVLLKELGESLLTRTI